MKCQVLSKQIITKHNKDQKETERESILSSNTLEDHKAKISKPCFLSIKSSEEEEEDLIKKTNQVFQVHT